MCGQIFYHKNVDFFFPLKQKMYLEPKYCCCYSFNFLKRSHVVQAVLQVASKLGLLWALILCLHLVNAGISRLVPPGPMERKHQQREIEGYVFHILALSDAQTLSLSELRQCLST